MDNSSLCLIGIISLPTGGYFALTLFPASTVITIIILPVIAAIYALGLIIPAREIFEAKTRQSPS